MAIASKTLNVTPRNTMLDSVFNPSGLDEIFVAENAVVNSRGESSSGNLYSAASSGSAALTANVVINVSAGSTGLDGVTRIVYNHYTAPSTYVPIYIIALSPAEEFTYAGTITITSATVTISSTMS